MKTAYQYVFAGILVFGMIFLTSFFNSNPDDDFIVISWNDLGMHCTNIDFSSFVVLPPYNTLVAQVIKKGNSTTLPELITEGYELSYEVPGNTTSYTKTNFWDYEDQLFGVDLPLDTGLTGNGMSGWMELHGDVHIAEGIPITPFTDDNPDVEDPYQLALIKLLDSNNNVLAYTQPVIPVSGEIGCVQSSCHSSAMDIIEEHDDVGGLVTPAEAPILCASCHATNALGTTGANGADPFSQVIHKKHEHVNDCYQCHPGSQAQCHRGVMYDNGGPDGLVCQDCHGTTKQVGVSVEEGRQDWLEEPSCGTTDCHGPNYAEEPGKLYRNSKGHGGLYCTACHGSPHAIVPSSEARDNVQNILLQGYAGTLDKCSVCHGYTPSGPGPHGFNPLYPSPCDDTVLVQIAPLMDTTFKAAHTVVGRAAFPSLLSIVFEAGNDIVLDTGFSISNGTMFEAIIVPCDSL